MSDRNCSRGQDVPLGPLKGKTMCGQDAFDLRLFQRAYAPSLTVSWLTFNCRDEICVFSACFTCTLVLSQLIWRCILFFLWHHSINLSRRPSWQIEPCCSVCSKQMQQKSSPIFFVIGAEIWLSICTICAYYPFLRPTGCWCQSPR